MIACPALPFFASLLADGAQIFISRMRMCFAIALLLNHGILARWNHRLCSALGDLLVAVALVICAIGGDLLDVVTKYLSVSPTSPRSFPTVSPISKLKRIRTFSEVTYVASHFGCCESTIARWKCTCSSSARSFAR
jgi:hypothetical protein